MIPSGEGSGAWSPEPDADPERTILRPDHIEDRPQSGCKIEGEGPERHHLDPRASGRRSLDRDATGDHPPKVGGGTIPKW